MDTIRGRCCAARLAESRRAASWLAWRMGMGVLSVEARGAVRSCHGRCGAAGGSGEIFCLLAWFSPGSAAPPASSACSCSLPSGRVAVRGRACFCSSLASRSQGLEHEEEARELGGGQPRAPAAKDAPGAAAPRSTIGISLGALAWQGMACLGYVVPLGPVRLVRNGCFQLEWQEWQIYCSSK
jgi:hypothetical protein